MRVRGGAGVTLLELTIVLGLAALILAIALPRLSGGLEGLRLRTASRQVAAVLRTARIQAVNERRTVGVTVDPRAGSVYVESGSGGTSRRYLVPSGMTLTILDASSRSRGDRPARIRFSPRGGSDGGFIGVGGAGRLIPIAIDPVTGRVTIQ